MNEKTNVSQIPTGRTQNVSGRAGQAETDHSGSLTEKSTCDGQHTEHHGTPIAAKFAREKKDRPTDWVIRHNGELQFVGSSHRAAAAGISIEELQHTALADALAELQRAAALATLQGRANVCVDYAGHAGLLYVRAYAPRRGSSAKGELQATLFTAEVWVHGPSAEPDTLARLINIRRAIQELNTETPA